MGVQANDPHRRHYEGLIKFRLAHSLGRSYLVPEVLLSVAATRYFLPSFFGPPVFAFDVEPGQHVLQFSMDAGPPRVREAARLVIRVRSSDRVKSYPDGAQLYRCSFEGPPAIVRYASGLARPLGDGDLALRLFHHTTAVNAESIRATQELWSSPWNLAGTGRLVNVAYTYLTSLPNILSEEDLRRIAMASTGKVELQTTSSRRLEEVLTLKVYRESTSGRTAPLSFWLPTALIAPPPLLLHPYTGREPAYYEVVGPEIARIGLKPGGKVVLDGGLIGVDPANLKPFSYVVLGDASTLEGLRAPYLEEDTQSIAHLEQLVDIDVFQFWLSHKNSDQVTGRIFEPKILDAGTETPVSA